MSVYNRLYKSLPREGHSQRENFLTEAFADLMNRLERVFPTESRHFIVDTLLRNRAENRSADALARRVALAKHIRWDTQQPIWLGDSSRKRPDIAINIDGKCALLVEVKIAAAFTKRTRRSPKELAENEEAVEQAPTQDIFYQLDDYGKWLFDHDPNAALVLLTHSKEAPEFLTSGGDSRYWTQLRSVCHWRGVYSWLHDWANKNGGNTDAESLARDFLEFLEEEGMSEMNEKDVQMLNAFLFSSRRWKEHKIDEKIADAMVVARQAMYTFLPPRKKNGTPKSLPEHSYDAFWDWSIPYDSPDDLNLHVGWGFSDAENSSFFPGLNLPIRLQAFIYVQGNSALKAIRNDKYHSWTVIAEEGDESWIRTRDAVDFAHSEWGFTQAFVQWLQPLGKEGAEILAAAWGTAKATKP